MRARLLKHLGMLNAVATVACLVALPGDFKKRHAMWEKVQTIFYAEAPRIKIGDYFRLDARRRDVAGYEPGPYMHFWNVWLDRR